MKKIRLLPLLAVLCMVFVLALASCNSDLEAPANITLDQDTQSITWDKVSGAIRYLVVIGDNEKTTLTNTYSLASLEPGDYEIKIKALGNGDSVQDSDFATFSYTREKESGLTYKLINNNTEYQLVGVGAASGDVVMEDIYRGKPVTSIAPSALSNNDKITSFVISKNIDSIPKKAFYNCNALVSVTIPDSVKSIGENAFQSCRSLTSVVLPESVTDIPDYAFSYCRALESVIFSSITTRIGDFAFSDCSALKSIEIPDHVTYVGEYAFSGCSAVTQVKIGASVETIGGYAFYSLPLVKSFVLPETLLSIGDSAFEECFAIEEIVVPAKVTSIGSRAFAFCEALASITIGNQVESIGRNAIMGTAYLKDYPDEIVYLGNWVITCTNPDIQENLPLTEKLRPETVGIAAYAFSNCNKFSGVSLPNVKYIGDYAFYRCSNMMDVRMGAAAKLIGDCAFAECTQLIDVLISNSSITYVGDYAFYNCSKLKKIDLPDTVEMIGARAFNNTALSPAVDGVIYADNWAVGFSKMLNNITLRDGTIGIAEYAFMNNPYISNVIFPDTIKTIGKGAFILCQSIYIEKMPAQLKTIGDYAFYGCTGGMFGADYKLILPEGLESIGRSAFYSTTVMGLSIPGTCKTVDEYAFFGCKYLGGEVEFYTEPPEEGEEGAEDEEIKTEMRRFYIELGEGIESIGSRAFYGTGIIELTLPNSLTTLGERTFYKCEDMKSAVIGSGLDAIPSCAFYACKSLESLVISDQTRFIEEKAFYGCSALKNVTLGSALESIGTAAFMKCEFLEDLVLPDSVTSVADHAFRGLKSDTSMIIPAGIENIGMHAFYGNNSVTLYVEGGAERTEIWSKWNSSWRPVVYGCVLSEDKSYVVSVEKTAGSVLNADAIGGLQAPTRVGYDFMGWATVQDGEVVYSAADIVNAPDGTTLYAIWQVAQIIE